MGEGKHYRKVGLLVLSPDRTKFLVCQKYPGDMTPEYIMPGGQFEEGEDDVTCVRREVKEELDCGINESTLKFIGEYTGPAAGGGDLMMRLYEGKLDGAAKPSSEIMALHWIGEKDIKNMEVSEFIRTRILPDLIKRKLLE